MKTWVLIVSENFPKSHPKAGRPTEFVKGIETGCKLHTIRNSVELWMERVDQVQRGEAQISLRTWTGRPYASKQRVIRNYTKEDGVGYQLVQASDDVYATVFQNYNERHCNHTANVSYTKLADNDGLLREDFDSWFGDWVGGCGKPEENEKIIIHLSEFRYLPELCSDCS